MRGHRLYSVIDRVQTGVLDRVAKCLEPLHVKRDVVVYDENCTRAVVVSISYVSDYAVEGIGVEVSAAHFDNRAETAIKRAAAGSLYDINRPAQHCVTTEDPRVAVGWSDLTAVKATNLAVLILVKAVAASECQAGYVVESASIFDRPQQFPKSDLALTSHYEINAV